MLVVSDHVTVDNACLQLPVDALRRQDELSDLIPAMNAVAVPTPVLLPGRLPGNSEPIGNVWPPNAQAGRVIDQHCEFRICAVPSKPGTFDSFKQLRCRQPGEALRCWRRCGCRLAPLWLLGLYPRSRPALRLAHASSMRLGCDSLVHRRRYTVLR
jgi:hypothetical protein